MGIALFTLPIGITALLLILLFSSNVAGWFVWGIYEIISVFLFIKSFTEYKSMLKGEPKSVTDIMGMASLPFTASVMGVILIIFIFLSINKLHLLWIFPIVALIFDLTIGKRAGDKISPGLFKKIEK